ncbi:NIF3-like protein 1 isoform X2 [Oratosquilla oratoria]
MDLKDVVKRLEDLAPRSLAESWDNVGLLVEPSGRKTVKSILLTNDLTEAVTEEAVSRQVDLVLSYHPPIFRPLKRITSSNWKERIIIRCIENGIAVYSPHTAHDALLGGVNDWLAKALEPKSTEPIQHSSEGGSWSHQVLLTTSSEEDAIRVADSLKQVLKSRTGTVSIVATAVLVSCQESVLALVARELETCAPNVQINVTQLQKAPRPGYGMGRLCTLEAPITPAEAVAKVKKHLGLEHVRIALSPKATMDSHTIRSYAVCAGSGASLLRGVRADLYLTGEMSHHEVLDANVQSGATVILCEHSNTERGYLKDVLKGKLEQRLEGKVGVVMSEVDRDPLVVV